MGHQSLKSGPMQLILIVNPALASLSALTLHMAWSARRKDATTMASIAMKFLASVVMVVVTSCKSAAPLFLHLTHLLTIYLAGVDSKLRVEVRDWGGLVRGGFGVVQVARGGGPRWVGRSLQGLA